MKKWYWPNRETDKKTLYINARIIDPESGMDINGQLLTVGSAIADFYPHPAKSPVDNQSKNRQNDDAQNLGSVDQIIDCTGKLLIPGLVDIHVHMREPGFEHKETIETGSRAAAAGGVTTVVCQPNTKPKIDNINTLKYVLSRPAYINIESYASISTEGDDNLTDMALLHAAGACGFTDDGLPVMNSLKMKQALLYARQLKVPIAQHAEDLTYTGCMNEGIVSEQLAVSGSPNISESMIVARDIQLLQTVEGAHYHLLHVSTVESLELIAQAKARGLKATCEVTPHHLLLTEEELRGYNCLGKVNPPLRSEADRRAMVQALAEGLIDCIASDHAPHEASSKETTLEDAAFGMVGVETLLPLSLELYHRGDLNLMDLLAKLTYKPAQIIGKKVGKIAKGSNADLALIDLEKEWIVKNAELSGKSQNSPYDQRKVRGMVLRTVVGGQTVFENSPATS